MRRRSQQVRAKFARKVETTDNELLLLMLIEIRGAQCCEMLHGLTEHNGGQPLNAGQLLTVLLGRTAVTFRNAPTTGECAALLWLSLRVAVERDLIKPEALSVPLNQGVANAGAEMIMSRLVGQDALDRAESDLLGVLLSRMMDRGPALRQTIETERREVPELNFTVSQLMLATIRLSQLISFEMTTGLLDTAADILWLCRALAFLEKLLTEPEPAQA